MENWVCFIWLYHPIRCARLFIPDGHKPRHLKRMSQGNVLKMLTVERFLAVVFDDHSESPYILALEPMQHELDGGDRDQYRCWIPSVALSPDGPRHEWLCRRCNPREEQYWQPYIVDDLVGES